MKIATAFLVTVALAAAEYTDIPNNPAFYEEMLSSEEAMKNLFGCLLDENPCDEFGKHAKDHIEESLKNSCKDCGSLQKHFARIFEEIVKKEEYKHYFQKLMAKYDPEGVYMKKLDKTVAGY